MRRTQSSWQIHTQTNSQVFILFLFFSLCKSVTDEFLLRFQEHQSTKVHLFAIVIWVCTGCFGWCRTSGVTTGWRTRWSGEPCTTRWTFLPPRLQPTKSKLCTKSMRSCRVLRYFNNLDFSRKGRTNFTQLAGSFFVTVVKFLLFPDTCMRLKISTGNWEVRWAPSADREEAETIPGEVCCHSEKENPPSPLVWTRNLQRLKR